MKSLEDLSHALLVRAQKAGATSADCLVSQTNGLSVQVLNGSLEHAQRSEQHSLALRVFVGHRQACVSATDSSDATLKTLSERAVAMAKEAPIDPCCGLPDPDQLAQNWNVESLELVDPAPEPTPDQLQNDALMAEAAASAVSGVSQVQSTSTAYGSEHVHIAATNGFSGALRFTHYATSCVAISGTGLEMEREYDHDARIFRDDMRLPEEIGRRAGERAASRRGARKPQTGQFPVLFDERISSSLIGHFLSAINGHAIATGTSWLRGAMDQAVFPQNLTLVENPHRRRISGSRPFDDEGLPTTPRKLVKNGVLRTWTLDCATARRLGLTSTANARRTASALPTPVPWNVELTQGKKSPMELMRDMGTGLLVTSLIGSTINSNTGDYSRGASGFWIEDGEVSYPVNECTIAGNLRQMLGALIPANDARPYLPHVVPSLLIESMTLAGK